MQRYHVTSELVESVILPPSIKLCPVLRWQCVLVNNDCFAILTFVQSHALQTQSHFVPNNCCCYYFCYCLTGLNFFQSYSGAGWVNGEGMGNIQFLLHNQCHSSCNQPALKLQNNQMKNVKKMTHLCRVANEWKTADRLSTAEKRWQMPETLGDTTYVKIVISWCQRSKRMVKQLIINVCRQLQQCTTVLDTWTKQPQNCWIT